jgi:hypothetical protein
MTLQQRLTAYEALLALSTSPTFTPVVREYLTDLLREHRELVAALKPFVESYERAADPVGDSDLYPEQPLAVDVTLGDCRKAAMLLRQVGAE